MISRGIQRTAGILKEIITIIMALAFTNAILVFLAGSAGQPKPISEFTITSILGFIALVLAIVRFFHGNHAYLQRTYNVHDYTGSLGGFKQRLVIDFVFIFVQAIVFCALSHYQSLLQEFYSLFTILFYLDSIWFFTTWLYIQKLKQRPQFQESEDDSRTITSWMVANFITASILLMLLQVGSSPPSTTKVIVIFAVLTGNTVLDYWLNWSTYFPGGRTKTDTHTVFLAARLTTAIDGSGTFDANLQKTIDRAYEACVSCGFKVISAHKTERFGQAISEPEDFVCRDFKDLARSHLLIAVLDSEGASSGVSVELGWASVLDLPILLAVPESCDTAKHPMVHGLCHIAKLETLHYASPDQLATKLEDRLQRYLA